MKKLLTLTALIAVVALFAGCMQKPVVEIEEEGVEVVVENEIEKGGKIGVIVERDLLQTVGLKPKAENEKLLLYSLCILEEMTLLLLRQPASVILIVNVTDLESVCRVLFSSVK